MVQAPGSRIQHPGSRETCDTSSVFNDFHLKQAKTFEVSHVFMILARKCDIPHVFNDFQLKSAKTCEVSHVFMILAKKCDTPYVCNDFHLKSAKTLEVSQFHVFKVKIIKKTSGVSHFSC